MNANLTSLLQSGAATAIDLLYPPECEGCGSAIAHGEYLCQTCTDHLPSLTAPFCKICSQEFHGEITQDFSCVTCGERNYHFDHAVARRRHHGLVRQLIVRFKYGKELHLRQLLADFLEDSLDDPRLKPFDLIVPVPLHPTRQRERGFNQAEEVVQVAAARRNLAWAPVLKRTIYTDTQTVHTRKERMENLRNAFELRKVQSVQSLSILIVDDVFTTGSTADECARVLCKAGASRVQVATIARG